MQSELWNVLHRVRDRVLVLLGSNAVFHRTIEKVTAQHSERVILQHDKEEEKNEMLRFRHACVVLACMLALQM